MVLNGARIYSEGISITDNIKAKIHEIMRAINGLTSASDVSIKLIKNGHAYEVMVWGSLNGNPLGLYNRGLSMGAVLENILRRAKKECLRIAPKTREAKGNQKNFQLAG